MGVIYQFKAGACKPSGVSAQALGETMERLNKLNRLTPEQMVEEARPADSPTHAAYEWNNQEAAEKYRQSQAQYYMRIVYSPNPDGEAPKENAEPVRVFHSVSAKYEPSKPYMSIIQIMNDKDAAATLMKNAVIDAKAYKQKYGALKDKLGGVFREIDALAEEYEHTEI